MANFNSKERFLASFLSRVPWMKQLVKSLYIWCNFMFFRKRYRFKFLIKDNNKLQIGTICPNKETFWGYYDKTPSNGNIVAFHSSRISTKLLPDPHIPVDMYVKNWVDGSLSLIGHSFTYNWQQGARVQWLSGNLLIYNDFRQGSYRAVVYSVAEGREIRTFDYPVQDAYGTSYFLSINYRRIMCLRPDYGYRNLPRLSDCDLRDLEKDGILRVDYTSGQTVLVHSLKEVIDCNSKPYFTDCLHKVNHVMINNTGTGFIFIHRYYRGKRRYDRLMYSDFKSLKVLVDDGMVSHCCWINDDTVLGYWRVKDKDGYYICEVTSGRITECPEMNGLGVGDGHPSCYKDWIVFDSYPDKSRMQKLFLYDMKNVKVIPLLEVYQSPRFMNQTRCDLHPRFSPDGRFVFFDTVYTGKRQLCYVDVSSVLN